MINKIFDKIHGAYLGYMIGEIIGMTKREELNGTKLTLNLN